jgi:hypothetical protein
VCGDPTALSVTLTDAVREPVPEGVNVTVMMQLPPASTLDPQVFVWKKSAAFAPVKVMFEMVSVAPPVF